MKLNNKQVAIVGGGPGGLTLARLLQLAGASVKVYERDLNKEARLIGSPLDMHEGSGLAALRKAKLLEEFKKNYYPGADRGVVVNKRGEIAFTDHNTKPIENFGSEHFRPEINRAPLRNMLLQSLQPDTVVWDSHFVMMETQGEGWLLHFKNGVSAYADLVVAADGANSKIRPYVTSIKAFYTGITMLEISVPHATTTAPRIHALLNGGKAMAFGDSKCLLGGQKGNDDLGFYASFKAPEGWAGNSGLNYSDKEQVLDWFKTTYSGWDPIWYQLFQGAATPFIPRPIYCMPTNQTWQARPNVTLIGDAPHVMPPFAGEGANMAMLDALELSECLTTNTYPTMQEAIAAFETNMRKRAAVAAQDSLNNGERMHSDNALDTMVAFFNSH